MVQDLQVSAVYVISVGCANKANPGSAESYYWPLRNAYIILSFCYSLGVFISRSSLNLFKIRRIEILTILQGLNLALWLFFAKTHWAPLWLQFATMIFVGLLGGASYVNVYYLVNSAPAKGISLKDRELAINMTAIGVTTGITLSSITILILDRTFLKS